jgi:hypothetical protein
VTTEDRSLELSPGTLRGLIDGPWQTEQEGHGPLIIAASLWLVWQARKKISSTEIWSTPFAGWLFLLGGLFLMFLASDLRMTLDIREV